MCFPLFSFLSFFNLFFRYPLFVSFLFTVSFLLFFIPRFFLSFSTFLSSFLFFSSFQSPFFPSFRFAFFQFPYFILSQMLQPNLVIAYSKLLTLPLRNIQLGEGFVQKTSMFWTVLQFFHCSDAELWTSKIQISQVILSRDITLLPSPPQPALYLSLCPYKRWVKHPICAWAGVTCMGNTQEEKRKRRSE